MFDDYLAFEQPILELEDKLLALKTSASKSGLTFDAEIQALQEKISQSYKDLFSKLSTWQVVSLARHPLRPHAVDIIDRVFDNFISLSGDRTSPDCEAIVGGLAMLNGHTVMVVAQEKGRDIKDKVKRNFGMPRPQGFRKAKRLFSMAEKFSLPVVTLLDSPGAYAGVDAELHNQSEAIAENILTMCQLKTPIVSVVIGEAMSGGAMAIGVCDHCAMLSYSIYSVISPEGCASILWKDASHAEKAADIMQVSAQSLYDKGWIDALIQEPEGGAHRDYEQTASNIKLHLSDVLSRLNDMDIDDLMQSRYRKWMLENLS